MSRVWRGLLLIYILFSFGCVSIDGSVQNRISQTKAPGSTFSSSAAQLSLFLSINNSGAPDCEVTITNIELGNGAEWHSLLTDPVNLNSADIGKKQVMLNRTNIKPGSYDRMKFSFKKPSLVDDGSYLAYDLKSQYEIKLNSPVILVEKDSTSLFLTWDIANTLADNKTKFSPAFLAHLQDISLTTELSYVSCPDIQTIYIIRTDTNYVSGSWGVAGKPTYLAAFKQKDELLVLMADQAAIKKIELSSGRIKDVIRIPTIIEPLFMVLDDDAQFAYILDKKSNYLVKMDLKSGGLLTRVRLTDRPDFLHYLGGVNQLAVSSTLSQKIFLLDANTLSTLSTLTSSSSPRGLYFKDANLYIAEGRANTVQVIDINSGHSQRRNVGRSPRRFIANDKYLYVANYDSGTVSILLPGQVNIIGEIKVGGNPEEMAISTTRNWLYINDRKGQGVSVVDLTSHRLAEKINLMASPFDIEVIQ